MSIIVSDAYEQNAQQMQHMQPYPGTPAYGHQQPGVTTVVVGAPAAYPLYPPKDHLVWSVISTILLCPILGIIAIIFSVKARDDFNAGNLTFLQKSITS